MTNVLHFQPALAPVKVGVLPLSKKLNEGAEKCMMLSEQDISTVEFDDRGATLVSVTEGQDENRYSILA